MAEYLDTGMEAEEKIDLSQPRERIPTYVSGLDEKIQGGIPKGHIVLIGGPAGSMKSSLGYYILYNAVQSKGLNGVYLSFEQSRESLLRNMHGLGMDHNKVANALTVVDLGKLRRRLKQIGSKTKFVNWFNSLENQIKTYKEMLDTDVMVIDSLNAMSLVSDVENPRDALFHLFEFIRSLGITTFVIVETIRGQESFGRFGIEEFLADGIIHLSIEREETHVGRYIAVIKMRETDHKMDYYPLFMKDGRFEITSIV